MWIGQGYMSRNRATEGTRRPGPDRRPALKDPFSPKPTGSRRASVPATRTPGPVDGPGVTTVAPPAARGDAAGCSPIQPDPVWHPCSGR